MTSEHPPNANPVGLLRRMAAIVYDSLLLAAILFLAALPTATTDIQAGTLASYLLLAYVALVAFIFFGWFWTHGGQTLGMKTWRFRVERFNGEPITWRDALARYLSALLSWVPLGFGFALSVFSPQRLALHDRLSRTRLVRVPKGTGPGQP